MKSNTFVIRSSTGKYDYVQDARCKHCLFCFWKPTSDRRTSFVAFCSKYRKSVSLKGFPCCDFEPNSKYIVVNKYVQLNLFENA